MPITQTSAPSGTTLFSLVTGHRVAATLLAVWNGSTWLLRPFNEGWLNWHCLIAILLLLAGCSLPGRKYDTGSIDFRYVQLPGESRGTNESELLEYKKFFARGGVGTVIQEGESISIKLVQAFVCDFAEDNPFPWDVGMWISDSLTGGPAPTPCANVGLTSSKHYTRGEIVILADAFELGDKKITFNQAFDRSEARVVYFSADVRESGQYMNMANLPIYGPITYNGRPMFLRLAIVELDNEENKQLQQMIGDLANFATQAYPPASGALKVLKSVGNTLLSGDQDDVEFDYAMLFDAPGGDADFYLPLKVGTYVLVRSHNRSVDPDWPSGSDYIFDNELGRLMADDASETAKKTSLRKYTYLVLKVSKNEKALEQDMYQSSYQSFAELAETTEVDPTDFGLLGEAATAFGKRQANVILYDDLRWKAAEFKGTEDAVLRLQYHEDLKNGICGDLFNRAQGSANEPILSDDQVRRLLYIAGPELAMFDTATANSGSAERASCAKAGTMAFWEAFCVSPTFTGACPDS